MNPINELFLTVLAQERPRWFGIAVRIVGRAEDAEDVLATCAVRLARARLDHVPPVAIRAYLVRTVQHAAWSFRAARWRAQGRQERLPEGHADAGADAGLTPLDTLLDAERAAERAVLAERARPLLSSLPPEQQRAVRWMYLGGEPTTLTSLAQAEGLSLTTARSRVQSGLHRLRRWLAQDGSRPPAV